MGLSAFLTSPLSRLILHPTYDRLAVAALARFYFPVSRLWAMALDDDGGGDAIVARLPRLARHRQRLQRAIAEVRVRAGAQADAHARWEDALFGGAAVRPESRARIERTRAGACQSLMTARGAFLPLVRAARLTPFGWDIQPHDAVETRHGARLAGVAAAFRMPDRLPKIELSQPVPGDGFETLWLRAETTVAGRPDTLWARVERPSSGGAAHAGTLVFTHGIAMETEFWRESSSLTSELAREGITVIRPEGPWHGRRRLAGTFGGEPTLALGPMGLLDYFDAHVRELGRLVAWARDTVGGPVAVGGVSLGALTAQMALMAARAWPDPCRPDAAFLVTTAGSLMDVAQAGSLTRALGMPRQLADSGWDRAALQRWMPLLEPGTDIGLDPARVVALLGTEDDILPYASGKELIGAWGLPPENLFVTPLGHFSAALGLYRNPAPLARLGAVLRETN